MIDGRINNMSSIGELEAKVKTGETNSLFGLAITVKNEGRIEHGGEETRSKEQKS